MALRAGPGQGAGDSVIFPVCIEREKLILRGKIEGGEADRCKIGNRPCQQELDRS